MGRSQREKGKRFEREIADVLRSTFPGADVSRSSQADRARDSDVVVRGAGFVDHVWWECNHAAKPNPIAKLTQAEYDTARVPGGRRFPVVVWRKHGSTRTRVTLRAHTLIDLSIASNSFALHKDSILELDALDFLAALAFVSKFGAEVA